MAEPTVLNLADALVPMSETAMMHTTAIRATSNAYSTRLAPPSPGFSRPRSHCSLHARYATILVLSLRVTASQSAHAPAGVTPPRTAGAELSGSCGHPDRPAPRGGC